MCASAEQSLCLMRLAPGHAAAIYALERQCFSLPWSEEQCRAAFQQKSFAAFGLFQLEVLVGYVSVYHTPDELEILNLAVLPQQRRCGYGRRILRAVLRLARKMGMRNALLEVRISNKPAICLYESCGFKRAGVRRKYYGDTGEDALIYSCSL